MAPTLNNVIVIGGGGNIGVAIVSALITSKFNVSVLTRLESEGTFPEEVKIFRSDYSLPSVTEIFRGWDAVVCALSHNVWGEQLKLIDAAVAAGVKRFIPSEYGTNMLNANLVKLFSPRLDAKVDVLELLRTKESEGLSWTGIATGPFFDWGFQISLFGFSNVKDRSAVIYDGGDRPFSTTNVNQVANAVVAVLSKPEETINKYLFVDSFTTTQNEILRALEKASGKWQVKESMTEAALRKGKELVVKGDYGGNALLFEVQ
ncbi:hypothetical protein BJ875DRAFT_226777 [Amylocarpus encephaloides]|uniref:NmrA-like domain-containing protein n=1 Tax=Amylocarpus encephaloides TaxID=45428 RepID=A0A9P8BZN6_9HELO|nr:hypothetical protein BJ875DRAFT_226777 [Amylocarpus encephaloides]